MHGTAIGRQLFRELLKSVKKKVGDLFPNDLNQPRELPLPTVIRTLADSDVLQDGAMIFPS